MSMTIQLMTALHGSIDTHDLGQSVELLARGGRRSSSHFFFFGGAGGMLWIPILALAFFGAQLMRNPDKARALKQKVKDTFGGLSAGMPASTQGHQPQSGIGGRPPRLTLTAEPGPPVIATGQHAPPPPQPAPAPPIVSRQAPPPQLAPRPEPPRQVVHTPVAQQSEPLNRPRIYVAPQSNPRVNGSTMKASGAPNPPRIAAPPMNNATRFNVPPNWPLPAGFTPTPAWQPDPSWPPAPAGWKFWA